MSISLLQEEKSDSAKSNKRNVNDSLESIKAMSFFSGAGGLDIGCHQAGVKVISALDFDKDSIKTLKQNEIFRNTIVHQMDIQNFDSTIYSPILKEHNPEKLILLGGPPCQPFSKAGYWVGHEARLGVDDPRNMIGEYLRVINEIKPDGFILENVESLLHPKNKPFATNIEEQISELGYYHKLIKANSINYGVPQKRKRVFFVASKNKFKTEKPIKTHGSSEEIKANSNLLPYETVGKWINKYDEDKYFEPQEVASEGTFYKDLVDVPPGKNYIALTAKYNYPNPKWKAGTRFWSFLLKLSPDIPSWTIAAQPGPWVGPLHWNNRRLRVPEIAAIQTFPEDYTFYGSRRSIQKQIGNAVPPLMGKAMVEFLKHNL